MTSRRRPCKLCGGTSRWVGSTINRASRTRALDHFRCATCGAVFVGNPISSEELAEAYGRLDWERYYAETGGQAGRKLEASAGDVERLYPGKECRVIDIGTGNGGFVKALWERGFRKLAAHDLPGSAFPALEGIPCSTYRDTDWGTIPDGAYDVATLLDVVEHVLVPADLLRAAFRVLAPGGRVYFHTPVVTPMDRLMHVVQKVPGLAKVGRIWQNGRTSIYHLQNYTLRSLVRLLREAGFGEIRISIQNELSWPIRQYVATYLTRPLRLPDALAGLLTPLMWPFLTFLNPNKATVIARKP